MSSTPYKVSKVVSRMGGSPVTLYKARAAYVETLDTRALAEKISFATALTPIEVSGVIEAFIYIVTQEVKQGKIVHLRDFGSFRLLLNSKAVELEKDADENTIHSSRIVFRTHKVARKKIKQDHYRKVLR